MGQTSQPVPGTKTVRPQVGRKALRRAVFETLDPRTLMCAVPHGPQVVGATVAWASAAITAPDATAADATTAETGEQPASLAAPRALAAPAPIRINAGGPAYTDPAGVYWRPDAYFSGTTGTVTAPYEVANTASDPLYYTRRYGSFNYNIPVAAAGTYTLRLHFADAVYTTAGKRNFAVRAENNTILNNFDVAANGGGRAAISRSFAVNVADGTLNLNFVKGTLENPIVSAIEVIPQNTSTAPAGSIAGLTLINAATNAPIGPLTNGAVLDTSGGRTYAVRADVSGSVGSVRFLLDGAQVRIEGAAPYSVTGDYNGDYPAWNVPAGGHTLTVVPYSGAGATGTAGAAYGVNFTVTAGTNPTPPPPNPTPVPPPPPTAGAFANIAYATKAGNPIIRAEALSATWNGRLYTFGGFSGNLGPVTRSDYFNPATNSWTRVADLPQRITHAGVAQDGQNVYFVGGYIGHAGQTGYGQTFGSNRVWRYNFASNSYSAVTNLPRALSGGGAAIIGRNLHYFGGQEANRGDTTVHLVLNLDNPAAGWQARKSMTYGRSHFGGVAVGGKLYAIAGQTGNDGGLVTRRYVEVYDPVANAWTVKNQIPKAVSHISSATFVMGGRILVMGGESSHNVQVRDVFAYNPATDGWTPLTPLPAARFSGAAGTVNGKIYFSTGGSQTTTWEGTPR